VGDQPASTRALLVEDDPNIVDLIRSNLAVRGFDTVVSTDGRRALQLLETEEPDIVLLDLMLPDEDGFSLCRQIRERSSVAVIVVSARGGERDKVTALNMGADDYMTKPFSVEELLARITATLRRTRTADGAQPGPPIITAGDVVIDLANQQVMRAGEPVHLTPTEFALLRELVINRGKLLSRTRLGRYIYAIGANPEAARRAGINVPRVRTAGFVLCSLTAGIAGLVYMSRLGNISTDIDGGDLVLYAVAAAVIGGTILFGGRGKPLHALLGGIVIAVVFNGLGLLGITAAGQDMATAVVLVLAVTLDSLVRRRSTVR
jgi:two-component system KDP operon response regulator KdpE